MWNPIKIHKFSKQLLNRGRDVNHYDEAPDGDDGDKAIVSLYSEMMIPSIFVFGRVLRSSEAGRKILFATGDKSEDHLLKEYIPKITDGEYLDSLSPNTVGAHYKHLINKWSFQELYESRFKAMPNASFIDKRRANVARHIFLAHDFWHVLFRYDTSPLGEACIQAVTGVYSKLSGPTYLAYLIAYKEYRITGSWDAFKVVTEARALAKKTSKEFYNLSFDELLELDVEVVRGRYNIGAPTKFYNYAKEYPRDFRFDCIHPEYNDPILIEQTI